MADDSTNGGHSFDRNRHLGNGLPANPGHGSRHGRVWAHGYARCVDLFCQRRSLLRWCAFLRSKSHSRQALCASDEPSDEASRCRKVAAIDGNVPHGVGLGMSVESGMSANKCAEVALRSTQNRYFTQHLETIDRSITGGDSLCDSFGKADVFSQDFLDAVAVGEETGRLGESMSTLSKQYEEQAKVAMHAMAIAGGVAVWALVAAIIIFFIFRFALFYVGLLENLMNGKI